MKNGRSTRRGAAVFRNQRDVGTMLIAGTRSGKKPQTKAPSYLLEIRPMPPHGDDPRGIRRLRLILKWLGRSARMRVVSCTPSTEPTE